MNDHREQLHEFLRRIGAVSALGAQEFDSLALLQIVAYLEQNYGIRLAGQDVEPDDLRSADGILSLIERFSHAAGSSAN